MARDVTQLREVLFDTLDRLRDKENPMDIDRAEAIATVAGAVINSAKVELDFLKAVGGTGTGFLPVNSDVPPAITTTRTVSAHADRTVTALPGGTTITRNIAK